MIRQSTVVLECDGEMQHTVGMLLLSQISKCYDHTQALSPTDLQVPSGETLVLIGPSGCGKSTLLRLIAGLIQPDSGSISFEGTALTPANVLQARRRMGYVIQEGGLFPHLCVRDNVTVMARYLRRDADWIDVRLAELAQLVRLPQTLMSRFPSELSGGQRQRVSLMRALMLDPDLLLLDEPLGALDPMIRYQLQQELKDIFAQLGKTVVMVTHDIAEAAFFGQTLVLMRNGRIVQTGSLKELARTPAEPFVEAFISAQRAPMAKLAEALG
jgi:osmoprotectant transport system ATP-binding protein